MSFHYTTIIGFWSLLACNLRLCKHFRDAMWSFSFTRHIWCHWSFDFSSRIVQSFYVILVARIAGHCRASALLLPILVFLDSERLHQCPSTLLATHDLVCKTIGSLSISLWHFGGFSFSRPIDIPIIIDPFFLHDIQISMSRARYVNVFQWNQECFFLRHVIELEVHCDDD